jgi:hypothetical protein
VNERLHISDGDYHFAASAFFTAVPENYSMMKILRTSIIILKQGPLRLKHSRIYDYGVHGITAHRIQVGNGT